uniref:GIY-YIG domain-containing protein n=1 Tax=Pseudomonas fluorescens (strain SBW25) TaxID=216595 RepID=A0A0G4E597_PSEFS|nr:GIY-YIG nuclease family protein [Pseudomonas fluorescens]CEK42344.1 hypothetical protein PQBR57_0391 [Pseudomonas fluorescens SBW25]
MPQYYYQIKGRTPGGEYKSAEWIFPPVYSGLVEAENRKEARAKVEDEYGRQFPVRVLRKDIEDHHYILQIRELNDQDQYLKKRFEYVPCLECGTPFRLIDRYNDTYDECPSHDYCKQSCKEAARFRDVREFKLASEGRLPAVIYQVRQKSTGMVYIGQTTQAFTLRWWQHLTNPSDCKFHEALTKTSTITDWEFSVLEVITYPDGCKSKATFISDRERHWIETLNSISAGYNTVRPAGINPQKALALDEDELF